MNQKAFGLKEFIILIAVIFICIIVIVSLYKSIFNTNATPEPVTKQETETYEDLENRLKLAAERYLNNSNYSSSIENTESWTLSYSMLKKEEYLEEIKDIKDKNIECNGYVEFIQDGGQISYKPFLKCGNNYQTEGYDSNNINQKED